MYVQRGDFKASTLVAGVSLYGAYTYDWSARPVEFVTPTDGSSPYPHMARPSRVSDSDSSLRVQDYDTPGEIQGLDLIGSTVTNNYLPGSSRALLLVNASGPLVVSYTTMDGRRGWTPLSTPAARGRPQRPVKGHPEGTTLWPRTRDHPGLNGATGRRGGPTFGVGVTGGTPGAQGVGVDCGSGTCVGTDGGAGGDGSQGATGAPGHVLANAQYGRFIGDGTQWVTLDGGASGDGANGGGGGGGGGGAGGTGGACAAVLVVGNAGPTLQRDSVYLRVAGSGKPGGAPSFSNNGVMQGARGQTGPDGLKATFIYFDGKYVIP